MASILPIVPENFPFGTPPVSYRFLVTFFIGGLIPNLLDIAFQKVSGISSNIDVTELREGGLNTYVHKLPDVVKYDNLVLERGVVPFPTIPEPLSVPSPLNLEFNLAMSRFTFLPSNVLVTLVGDPVLTSIPKAAWLFSSAYPVKWSTSDLDAEANTVIIDSLELAYTNFKSIRI